METINPCSKCGKTPEIEEINPAGGDTYSCLECTNCYQGDYESSPFYSWHYVEEDCIFNWNSKNPIKSEQALED